MVDAIDAILTRRSIRSFMPQPVSDEQIDTLLNAMIAAPSAGNMQPWRIVVVKDPDVKQMLAIGALKQDFIAEAPVVFVICRVPNESSWRYGDRGGNLYSFQDTATMGENLLIAANSMGLGACWVGAFRDEEVAKAINCPKGVYPVAIIPVGHPKESARTPGRRSLKDVVRFIPER
ncbi:MAG: nitroreductase family protein [Promethearchaeota archaeon]